MQRRVEPEILDELPADHPDAVASRRDLRRINAIMGNHRWLARRIRANLQPGWCVLELGAGDGTLGLRLAQKSIVPPGCLLAADLAPRPPSWPPESSWLQQDVLLRELPDAEIIIANLFLHHFEAPALRELAQRFPPSCRVLLCSEPARRTLHLWQARLLALLPLNRVTRHDMPVSIRAGFSGPDLPDSLGLSGWKFHVSTTFFGAYRLEAHLKSEI